MQNKRYNALERQTLAAAGGLGTISIQNGENTEVNYHGIRAKGRVIIDISDANPEFGSGWITLMCLPPGVAVPLIDSAADAEANQNFIIACEQWSAFGGGAATDPSSGNGGAGCYDFDIVPRTSRNCSKDAQITLQVVNESGSIAAILTCLLSTFETTN